MSDKPLSIVRREFIEDICRLVNNAGLPGFVVVDCLERILTEARNLADAEYQRDAQMYAETNRDTTKRREG